MRNGKNIYGTLKQKKEENGCVQTEWRKDTE